MLPGSPFASVLPSTSAAGSDSWAHRSNSGINSNVGGFRRRKDLHARFRRRGKLAGALVQAFNRKPSDEESRGVVKRRPRSARSTSEAVATFLRNQSNIKTSKLRGSHDSEKDDDDGHDRDESSDGNAGTISPRTRARQRAAMDCQVIQPICSRCSGWGGISSAHSVFRYLWAPKTWPSSRPSGVVIPPTAVFTHGVISAFYFSTRDGRILRKRRRNLTTADIINSLLPSWAKNSANCKLGPGDAGKAVGSSAYACNIVAVARCVLCFMFFV